MCVVFSNRDLIFDFWAAITGSNSRLDCLGESLVILYKQLESRSLLPVTGRGFLLVCGSWVTGG